MYDVSVIKYEAPSESLRKAVDLVNGLEGVSSTTKVFVKPNFCQWYDKVRFPKYGVITTARLIEDVVVLLKERGVEDITMLEGAVEVEKTPESTVQLVAAGMGLDLLTKRYGVKVLDVMREEFSRVTAGDLNLSVNKDILGADFVINMPVLKTHSQTMVSLGIKNLKGLLSIPSRKRCHDPKDGIDLNHRLARLPEVVWPDLTVLDGIYTLERGPLITGRAHLTNLIIASKDIVSADKVGSTILGIDPRTVPHLVLAAGNCGRPADLSDVRLVGETDIASVTVKHEWEFEQNATGDLPAFFEKAGVKGITYPQADNTMCTYCADFIYYVIWGVLMSRNRDEPFDDIEVLHGKTLDPQGGHKHTLLVGQCQVKRNSDNPKINHCVKIRGCPPSKKDLVAAYRELGIMLPDNFLAWMARIPENHMRKYQDSPEFDESFYVVK